MMTVAKADKNRLTIHGLVNGQQYLGHSISANLARVDQAK